MLDILFELVQSWSVKNEGIYTIDEIKEWYYYLNNSLRVNISFTEYEADSEWAYNSDTDRIERRSGSFFSIAGLINSQEQVEQPVILQQEIGYLGMITQMQNGVLHFLIQAKIEPGNVNKVQLSPTIQATHSNFTKVHKGAAPKYLEYFLEAGKHKIIFDQIQSEQSSRFLGKRNRNIVIYVDESVEIELYDNYRWVTLGQIKELMKIDNIVNMDTRTVISCIPFSTLEKDENINYLSQFSDKILGRSVLYSDFRPYEIAKMYHYINNYKMFHLEHSKVCGLSELPNWYWDGSMFVSDKYKNFRVIFCDVEIEKREVLKWQQPLFQASGNALFALAYRISDGIMEFLVQCKPESGCFDQIELAPTWQLEANERKNLEKNNFGKILLKKIEKGIDIRNHVLLSEEGGRFYHEQNENIIFELNSGEVKQAPGSSEGYFWLTYNELNTSMLYNNVLNIQLRNLLSILSDSNG
ncbi:MAG TPA: dNDP-4-keto-6-deoxy-glucose-2,3- dehydratase [Clostridiaceae bacterium]|nr:dNDP-4-keto-6-deoxy-glucose-2,3- dehydratase [Clostridiaceae bacterium]